jgi:integrase
VPRTCAGCGEFRRHHAAGLCGRCYRLSKTTLRLCTGCGEVRPIFFADQCERCKAHRRSQAGECKVCGREVRRLWRGMCRRCDNRAYDYEGTGSCDDCLCWTPLLLRGACPACLLFRRGHPVAICPACRRELPIGAAGHCRLCQTAARSSNGGIDPGKGVQLFIVGAAWAPRHRRMEEAVAPRSLDVVGQRPIERTVQLRLRPVPQPKRRPTGRDAKSAARNRRRPQEDSHPLVAAAVGFGQARGWSAEVIGRVVAGLSILVNEPGIEALDVDDVQGLKARGIPPLRILEFLRDRGVIDSEDDRLDVWVGRRLDNLSPTVRAEVQAWIDALRGRTARGGRPRSPHTVKGYLTVLRPCLQAWSKNFESLREVTEEECELRLGELQGSVRRLRASALRSLFASLKAQRLIFANPASRIAVGPVVHRPVLTLDPAARRQLLAEADAPGSIAVLLAGIHGLRCSEIAGLTLDAVDFAAGTLLARGQIRALDQLTLSRLRAWVEDRRTRWPMTANPHLLVNQTTAGGVNAVTRSFVQGLLRAAPVTVETLRRDGLLAQARDANGDPLTLAELFGLAYETAIQYCRQVTGDLVSAGD